LSCPIAVPVPNNKTSTKQNDNNEDEQQEQDWKVICWIDSKALFGDVYTHNTSVLPQAESYVHRFGPGLVLYWFGHAPLERLKNDDDVLILGWQLPNKIMLPTGKVISTVDENNGAGGLSSSSSE
jgi:hypothetical protein